MYNSNGTGCQTRFVSVNFLSGPERHDDDDVSLRTPWPDRLDLNRIAQPFSAGDHLQSDSTGPRWWPWYSALVTSRLRGPWTQSNAIRAPFARLHASSPCSSRLAASPRLKIHVPDYAHAHRPYAALNVLVTSPRVYLLSPNRTRGPEQRNSFSFGRRGFYGSETAMVLLLQKRHNTGFTR